MGFDQRFQDTRAACSRLWGSSYFRQFLFTLVPLGVLVIIVVQLNDENQTEQRFVTTTVTVSSSNTVVNMVGSYFTEQITSLSQFSESIANRIVLDPYSPSMLLSVAQPLMASNDALTRLAITNSDRSASFLSATDATSHGKSISLVGTTFGDSLSQIVLNYSVTGKTIYQPGTTGNYANAIAQSWLSTAAGVAAGNPYWVPPNTSTSDDTYWVPALVTHAELLFLYGTAADSLYVRVTMSETAFVDMTRDPVAGVSAYVIDGSPGSVNSGRVYAARSPDDVGKVYSELTLVRPFLGYMSPPLIATTSMFQQNNLTLYITPLNVAYATLLLITVGDNNTIDAHQIALSRIHGAFDPVIVALKAAVFTASSGALRDLEDPMQVVSTVGPYFCPLGSTVGTIQLAGYPRDAVYKIENVGGASIAHVSWATNKYLSRLYALTGVLASRAWSDTTAQADFNAAQTRLRNQHSESNGLQLYGPVVDTAGTSTMTTMHLVRCLNWPTTAFPYPYITNHSCVHAQFGLDALNVSLVGMRLDNIGTSVVTLSDGTVLGAAGTAIPMTTAIIGMKVWDVVPQWNQALRTLLFTPTSGANTVSSNNQQFSFVNVSKLSDYGITTNVLVITIISDDVSQSALRTAVVAAVDFLAFFVALLLCVHGAYFIYHMLVLGRVTRIVAYAAELHTDDIAPGDPLLNTHSFNKDVESMLISAATLFVHMKRIRGCLPDFILQQHQRDGVIVSTSGAGQAAIREARPARSVEELTTPAPVQQAQVLTLQRHELLLIAVIPPTDGHLCDPAANGEVQQLLAIVNQHGGGYWVTDRRGRVLCYWESDRTSRGIAAVRALAAALPHWVIAVSRGEATYGIVGSENIKSFMITGPALDTVQCIATAVRQMLGVVDPATCERDIRKSAPIVIDSVTLMRLDPTAVEGCLVRTIGAVPNFRAGAELEAEGLGFLSRHANPIQVRELLDTLVVPTSRGQSPPLERNRRRADRRDGRTASRRDFDRRCRRPARRTFLTS